MNKRYTKEILEPIVQNSTSWRQVILYLGLKETGGNYKNLQNRCNDFEIDYSHFTGQGWNKSSHPSFNKNHPIDDFLKEGDKTLASSRVRCRLLANGLKENKCEKCGITEWCGEPITIQLHHINGNRKDNRLENLQMLCPNCHSQTDNFCKRKILLSTNLSAPKEILDV